MMVFLAPFYGVFSASEKWFSWSSSQDSSHIGTWVTSPEAKSETGIIKKDEKKIKKINIKEEKEDSVDDENFSQEEKERVQREIGMYILEAYKFQWNKILKDIDVSLQKINSDSETRIQAYFRIQKTLEMRRKRVQNMDLSDNNKEILTQYLDYMIAALEKRQIELKD